MSDLSFLSKLKELGYNEVDVKGLRYDPLMSSWMNESALSYYVGTEGREILPEDGWREKIAGAGLVLRSLKDWTAENQQSEPRITKDEAIKSVMALMPYTNITSPDSDEAVLQSAINRRL